ncbi:hypothetical protein halTADL_2518 [Halohasta litchfieldiae]|jgi:hypothetical protein|uniref:Uncharacterized protein n=1 Tax=Halohasta litchfieldiae TaxID=1073996 RepID=A0A1H6RQM7_9EURY|nr:hypothetical protein [Halohasta litchfieldiae]ATW89250.1 hypothetical protein halTADL_2518 [Halohasta litchfieldiae]SEI58069.1 hypothetical protein SAMN05444271_10339 [Halohasta litchfieldiae]
MTRRSFFVAVVLLLSILFAGLAVSSIRAGESAGYGYAVVAVLQIAAAVGYWVHPKSVVSPDDPAPREWFELAGLVVAALVVSALLLFVAIG